MEKVFAEDKPAKEESPKPDPIREASRDELEKRDNIWYFKGATEPFTGTAILYREGGSKRKETTYENGKEIFQ